MTQENKKRYTSKVYLQQKQYNGWMQACFLTVLAHIGLPDSALLKTPDGKVIEGGFCDYGCGTGINVATAYNLGVFPTMGLELSKKVKQSLHPDAEQRVHLLDLSDRVDWSVFSSQFKFNLQWTTNVAEHIAPEHAFNFAYNLATSANEGAFLIFAASEEEDGDFEPLNLQPREYWREMLEDTGYHYAEKRTDELVATWLLPAISGPCFWLPQNLQVFRYGIPDEY